MDDEPRIPKLIGGAGAAHTLPLAAVDGFVLSRIDGKASEKDLSSLTGLSVDQVRSSLEKLVSLRVITLEAKVATPVPPVAPAPVAAGPRFGEPRPSTPASPPRSPSPPAVAAPAEDATLAFAAQFAISKRLRAAIAAIPEGAAELTEDVDLAGPFRLRILGACATLSSLDYYELLGVERAAEKKRVKNAYFEFVTFFHPDRYFRKRLGSFKPKMETLFGTVTQAFETLSDKVRRAEYDKYLVDLDRTRGIEDLLKGAAEEAQRAEEDALRVAERTVSDAPLDGALARSAPPGPNSPERKPSGFYSSVRPPSLSTAPQEPSPVRRPASLPPLSAPPVSSTSPVVSDQARRDALAMRLRGNRPLSRGTPSTPPAAPRANDGGGGLKRRYEERVALARKAQAEKYVALAREAEAKNDVVGAAAAYRVTLGFLQENDPIRVFAQTAIAKADAILAETYLRQAAYEERAEHWPDAAKSWQRVAKGRPDEARAHERAANAMAKARVDLHAAAQYAKRAIELDPRSADYRITLATVFIEAGLGLNARRELEVAAQLSPRNATIQALLKTVNKAG